MLVFNIEGWPPYDSLHHKHIDHCLCMQSSPHSEDKEFLAMQKIGPNLYANSTPAKRRYVQYRCHGCVSLQKKSKCPLKKELLRWRQEEGFYHQLKHIKIKAWLNCNPASSDFKRISSAVGILFFPL